MRAIPFIVCSILMVLILVSTVHYVVVPVIYPCNATANITVINHTIYKERIITKEVLIDKPCNTTRRIYVSSLNNSCDVLLIKQIQQLELIIDRWAMNDINITINETTINATNSTNNNTGGN